ncbi:MAG: vanadium-dependent haloperoxidase [Saprospiraceae bacterium]|nr:vanadium-dependent haloperoxidase [Saprospiraceae bacterium]MCB9343157.1 vanadium-dependent haloperoxidase [Lewinellaceae bacterium]
MKNKILISVAFSLLFWLPACNNSSTDYQQKATNPEFMHAGIKRITDIIRHDIFAPPVAARIYAYSAIAGYEALVPGFPEYQSITQYVNGLGPCPKPEAGKEYCYPLASINALLTVGKALIFSEGDVEELEEKTFADFKAMNMPGEVYDRSMAFGDAIAQHIITWSKSDNYAQTRSAPKFEIKVDAADRWRPTPPAYGDALEPYWMTIRTWVLDSASQFMAGPPVDFSIEKGSDFYKQAMEVYDFVNAKREDEVATAWYWDDNPFAMEVSGHIAFARKKIGPGGHWMNITAHACRKANYSIIQSAEAYAKVACALADGFISSWTAKYKYDLIRPESYINQYIDPAWTPLIQSPPFPEHTSAHSTISGAASTVLTNVFGDNFSFTDSTEMEFGIDPRSFNSFREAADQVGMSRLYGGIHYSRGNQEGLRNGREIGQYIFDVLKTKK